MKKYLLLFYLIPLLAGAITNGNDLVFFIPVSEWDANPLFQGELKITMTNAMAYPCETNSVLGDAIYYKGNTNSGTNGHFFCWNSYFINPSFTEADVYTVETNMQAKIGTDEAIARSINGLDAFLDSVDTHQGELPLP